MTLYGHDAAVAAFRAGFDEGRLHHAWLITGPQGIGKSRFADQAALRLLAHAAGPQIDLPGLDVPADHRIARLAAAGSHPDLMRLERLTRESGTDLARNITIEQVRRLGRLFATTATFSPWRVVIVDAIDDMERGAANALLKSLEEPPPNSLFLLVSHAPERLLPTIRSRCRLLRLAPLDDDAMTSALKAALPEADDKEIAALRQAGEGAPGRALAFQGLDVEALDKAMAELVAKGDPTNARRVALAQSLASKSAQPRYEAFLARMPSLVAATARQRRGRALDDALRVWERSSEIAGSATRLSLDPQTTVFELAGMLAALAPKQTRASGYSG